MCFGSQDMVWMSQGRQRDAASGRRLCKLREGGRAGKMGEKEKERDRDRTERMGNERTDVGLFPLNGW
jgi:hypothetical protein